MNDAEPIFGLESELLGILEQVLRTCHDAADPMLLVPLAIVALSLFELRRCIREGWHNPEDVV